MNSTMFDLFLVEHYLRSLHVEDLIVTEVVHIVCTFSYSFKIFFTLSPPIYRLIMHNIDD
jgi:hypothetical protein